MDKSRLFVGSSRENLELAGAIQESFEFEAEVMIWNQGTFPVSEYPLESLENELDRSDFAVFVFVPDDVTIMRGEPRSTVRDNVIFELGLFVGRLGRKRTFIISPRGSDLHLPSDLLGLTSVTYDPDRSDDNLVAALGPASRKIRSAMRAQGRRVQLNTAEVLDIERPVEDGDGDFFNKVLTPSPEWSLGQYENGFVFAVFEKRTAAEEAINSAFRSSPLAGSEEALAVWEAWCDFAHMLGGRPSGGITSIRNRSLAYPENARLRHILARALARYGDVEGACSAFSDAVARAADIGTAAAAISGAIETAASAAIPLRIQVEKLRSRLFELPHSGHSENATFVKAMRQLAAHEGLHQIALALDECRLKIEPDDIYQRFAVGHAYGEIDEPRLALLHYERIPETQRSGTAWNNLGVAYSSLAMRGMAISAFKRASEKGETIADGNIANKLVAAGFLDEANARVGAALKDKDHHPLVVAAASAIQSAKAEEEKAAATARATAAASQEFWLRVGEASIVPPTHDIVGMWLTPDGPVELGKLDDGSFLGRAEVRHEVNSLGLRQFLSSRTTETVTLEYRLRRFGDSFEGVMKRQQQTTPVALLGSYSTERKVVFILSHDGMSLVGRVGGQEELVWNRGSGSVKVAIEHAASER